jgi:hypothetical protein
MSDRIGYARCCLFFAGHTSSIPNRRKFMSRRFMHLLERTTRIREMIDREQRSPAPSAMRLMRMKQLYLQLSQNLRSLTRKRVIAMASAPRLRPDILLLNTRLAATLTGRW